MRKLGRISFAALAILASPVALGQENVDEEQSDPYEELGLIDQSDSVDPETIEDAAPDASEAGDTPLGNAVRDPDAPVTEEDVEREYNTFTQYLEEQNFDEADISAKRVIEMSIRVYGPQSRETAKALNNLGIVQNNARQFDAAVQNFTSAIEILEIVEDRLSSEIVNPLRGLGVAHLGAGRPDLAARAYGRATHITHVNEGPHNIEQVELLDAMAEAQLRLGDIDAARDILDRVHILNVRHFADNATGLLPSLMRRAAWQHRAGYYDDERATYRRAIRIIEEASDREDPRLVTPLVKLGKSFYYIQPMTDVGPRPMVAASGEVYLKRAARIAERSEEFPWLDLATTKLALADYYTSRESFSRAGKIYNEVWNALSADEDRLDMRRELLEQPTPIWSERLPQSTNAARSAKDRRDGGVRTGTVRVTYVVTPRGRASVQDVTVEPAEFENMARAVGREIRRRKYRPMIAEGETVGSGTQVFEHEFRYLYSELEEMREEANKQQETTAATQ